MDANGRIKDRLNADRYINRGVRLVKSPQSDNDRAIEDALRVSRKPLKILNHPSSFCMGHMRGWLLRTSHMINPKGLRVECADIEVNNVIKDAGQPRVTAVFRVYAFATAQRVVKASITGDVLDFPDMRFVFFAEASMPESIRNGWAAKACFNVTAAINGRWDEEDARGNAATRKDIAVDKSMQMATEHGYEW